MSGALAAFVEALAEVRGHVEALAGAPAKWKDVDAVLRHALPETHRRHGSSACRAAQVRDARACVATCLPTAGWWAARRWRGHWRPCHAGVVEYTVPVRRSGTWIGSLQIGPYAAIPADRTVIERVAAWAAASILWIGDLRDQATSASRQGHGRHPGLQRALGLVVGRARRDLDLAGLAREAGLSPSRLTHLCREETGRSLSAWRDEAVLAKARRLLAEGDLDIAAVAAHCGYARATHFAAAFRRTTGLTPTAFRRRLLSERP